MTIESPPRSRSFIDRASTAAVGITYAHYRIHAGSSFVCGILTTNTTSLGFKTPAGLKQLHMIIKWAAESKATFELWEGRTWTPGTEATTSTIFNRNRNSDNASIVLEDSSGTFAATGKMLVKPTPVVAGTLLDTEQTWSDKKETSVSRGISEFISKADETYVALLTSNDGVKGTQIVMNWYENTDKTKE